MDKNVESLIDRVKKNKLQDVLPRRHFFCDREAKRQCLISKLTCWMS